MLNNQCWCQEETVEDSNSAPSEGIVWGNDWHDSDTGEAVDAPGTPVVDVPSDAYGD